MRAQVCSGKSCLPVIWCTLVFCLPEVLVAQPTLLSTSFFGGPGDQQGNVIAVRDNAVYVGGTTGQLVRYPIPPGVPDWSRESLSGEIFRGIATTSSKLYPVGQAMPPSCGAIDFKPTKHPKSMRSFYDSGSGDFLDCLSTNYFGFMGNEGYNAAVEASSLIYVAGFAETCATGKTFVLSSLDLNGALQIKSAVEPGGICIGASYASGLAMLNGFLYVAGYSNLLSEDGANRPVLMKYGTDLTRKWKVRPADNVGAYNAATAFGGAIYAVGYSTANGNGFLIDKYDEAGNRIWSRTSGGAGDDELFGVVGIGSRIYAVGFTTSQGAGGQDMVILEIDPDSGATLSTTLFGGAFDDAAYGAATDGTDLYVVGTSRSFASAAGNQVGEADIVLLRYKINIVQDNTPPSITPSITGTLGNNGWYTSAVTVSWTVQDPQSSITASNGCSPVTLGSETAGTTLTCTATSAGGTASQSVTIKIDMTPPTVTFGAASPAANAAGWNNTNVSVPFTVTDTMSGVSSANPANSPLLLVTEGSAVTATITVTDNAGNTTTFTTSAFRIDRTPPAITGSRTPLPNANGWNNTDVSVSFSCSDSLSGLAAGSPPAATTLNTDGVNQSATGNCQDVAGNSTSVTVTGINIDKTPPTATAAALPAANAAGWNNSNVTVSFTGTDNLSGIDSCTPAIVLSAEGTGQSANGTCTDKAGNVSAAAVIAGINIDKTPPVITFGPAAPAPNAAGWNNTNVSIPFTVTDSLSGVQSANPAASPLVLTAEGAAVAGVVTATDIAGNTVTITSPAAKIDKTPPVLLGSRFPLANVNGWNNTDVTVSFTCSDAGSGVAALIPGAPVVVSSEGANQSVTASCQDVAGNISAFSIGGINIDKTKPVVSGVITNPSAVTVNSGFTLSATVTDAGSGTGSTEYNIDNGPFTGMTLADATAGLWSTTVSPLPVSVHTACVRSTDLAMNQSDPVCILVPVYDPAGGFVTGGGWIVSPGGAYPSNPAISGQANFGFVSKYLPGDNVPSGDVEFHLQDAGLDFKSTVHEWLVVTGARAQFKGSGTVGGTGDYGFLLTAIAGQGPGNKAPDQFRIKIWQKNSDGSAGTAVYDNQMGASDTGNDATLLGGGNITIH